MMVFEIHITNITKGISIDNGPKSKIKNLLMVLSKDTIKLINQIDKINIINLRNSNIPNTIKYIASQ